jgi:hypothetical protein
MALLLGDDSPLAGGGSWLTIWAAGGRREAIAIEQGAGIPKL